MSVFRPPHCNSWTTGVANKTTFPAAQKPSAGWWSRRFRRNDGPTRLTSGLVAWRVAFRGFASIGCLTLGGGGIVRKSYSLPGAGWRAWNGCPYRHRRSHPTSSFPRREYRRRFVLRSKWISNHDTFAQRAEGNGIDKHQKLLPAPNVQVTACTRSAFDFGERLFMVFGASDTSCRFSQLKSRHLLLLELVSFTRLAATFRLAGPSMVVVRRRTILCFLADSVDPYDLATHCFQVDPFGRHNRADHRPASTLEGRPIAGPIF